MRRLVVAALALALLATSACEDRKPIPTLTITVLSEPGMYQVNQQRMDGAALDAELKRVSDENRRKVTGQVRGYVFITAERGVDFYRTDEVVDRCARLGFVNIQRGDTGMK
jgi:biopolymer transport protein ExbD